MKTSICVVLAAPYLAFLSNALYLQKKDSSPAVLELPIQRSSYAGTSKDTLIRRSNPFAESLRYLGTSYVVQLSIGVPKDGGPVQNVLLELDTGDSTLWVNSASNPLCKKGNRCAEYGTFNPRFSATSPPAEQHPFFIAFNNGDKGSGIVYKDQLRIGSTVLKGVEFGLITSGNTPLGNMGLGYYKLQETAPIGKSTAIPTFTQVLLAKGIIKLQAYSVFLNQENAPIGFIIFGGVDTDKFSGKLSTLPVLKESGVYQELIVKLGSVSYAGRTSPPCDALVDTGSPFVYLQNEIVQALRDAVNAEYDEKGNNHYVSCKLKGSKDTIKFSFGGTTVKVPLGSFVLAPDPDLPFSSPKTGEILCGWGILTINPDAGRQSVLGTNFLRSAYVVFDLSNNEISIAQASYSSGSRVVEIPRGGVTALDIVGTGTDELDDTGETAVDPKSQEIQTAMGDTSTLNLDSEQQPSTEQAELDNTPISTTEANEHTTPHRPPPQGDLALLPDTANVETQSTQQQSPSQSPFQGLENVSSDEQDIFSTEPPGFEPFNQPPT